MSNPIATRRIGKLRSLNGTKQIVPLSEIKDKSLYEAFERRIEHQKSVKFWAYEEMTNRLKLYIVFRDQKQDLLLDINSANMTMVQQALETVSNFFIAKQERQ